MEQPDLVHDVVEDLKGLIRVYRMPREDCRNVLLDMVNGHLRADAGCRTVLGRRSAVPVTKQGLAAQGRTAEGPSLAEPM